MKTRTLMLLALGCGVAIMLAGAVFLVQLSSQDELAVPVPIGDAAMVGDMSVIVVESEEIGGALDVVVRIGGVDDADGALGFRLIASGRPVNPEPADRDGRCSETSVEDHECVVRSTSRRPTARRVSCSTNGGTSRRDGCSADPSPTPRPVRYPSVAAIRLPP